MTLAKKHDYMTDHEERFYNIVAFLTKCHLKEHEIIVLILRKFCFWTLRKIGNDYDVTKERIRQIEAKGIRKIYASKIGVDFLK